MPKLLGKGSDFKIDSRSQWNPFATPDQEVASKEEETVRIEPDVMYRPSQIERLLGIRCLNLLRKSGLRAVGGWYFGRSVLETIYAAWQNKNCQRVSAGKEVADKAEHAAEEEEDRVEESSQHGKIPPVSKRGRQDALLSQMEEIGRDIRES